MLLDLESAYFLAQILAVLLLAGSLIFVGSQLRLSQRIERANAQRNLLQRIADWDWNTKTDEEIWWAVTESLKSYPEVSNRHQAVFESYCFGLLTLTEAALSMRKDGFFTDGTWAGIEGGAIALIKTNGGANYWNHARLFLGFEIAQHLDKRLNEVGDTIPAIDEFLPSGKGGYEAFQAKLERERWEKRKQ